jgi:hypothetical protein
MATNTTNQTTLDQAGMMTPEEYARQALAQRQTDLSNAATPVDQVTAQRSPTAETTPAPRAPLPSIVSAQGTINPMPGETITPIETSVDARQKAINDYYQQYLGRTPDQAGSDYWYKSGMSIPDIQKGISSGQEAGTEAARASDITRLYQQYLGRTPDANGIAYWLSTGMGYDQLAKAISSSQESGTYSDYVKNEKPLKDAYAAAKTQIQSGIPLINQKYQDYIDKIDATQRDQAATLDSQRTQAIGAMRSTDAMRGIIGSSMEAGTQAQLGEAYGRASTNLGETMLSLRNQATTDFSTRINDINNLLAQSDITEVDKVSAARLAAQQADLEQRLGNAQLGNLAFQEALAKMEFQWQQAYQSAQLRAATG